MPDLIEKPTVPANLFEADYGVGGWRQLSNTAVSVARMGIPAGWTEPRQTLI